MGESLPESKGFSSHTPEMYITSFQAPIKSIGAMQRGTSGACSLRTLLDLDPSHTMQGTYTHGYPKDRFIIPTDFEGPTIDSLLSHHYRYINCLKELVSFPA